MIPDFWFVLLGVVGAVGFALALLNLTAGDRGARCTDVPLFRRVTGRLRHANPVTLLVGGSTAAYTFGLFALSAINSPMYDRYLIPTIAWLSVLLARPRAGETPTDSPVVRPAAVTALILLGVLGLIFTTDAAADRGLRWRFAQRLAEVTPAADVGGGFEWQGWHRGASDSMRPDEFCLLVEYVQGQAPPGAPTDSTRGLTREIRVVARPNPDCGSVLNSPTPGTEPLG